MKNPSEEGVGRRQEAWRRGRPGGEQEGEEGEQERQKRRDERGRRGSRQGSSTELGDKCGLMNGSWVRGERTGLPRPVGLWAGSRPPGLRRLHPVLSSVHSCLETKGASACSVAFPSSACSMVSSSTVQRAARGAGRAPPLPDTAGGCLREPGAQAHPDVNSSAPRCPLESEVAAQ